MTPEDARLIIEAHEIAALFDDEEEAALLKEHNPALFTSYEHLFSIAENTTTVKFQLKDKHIKRALEFFELSDMQYSWIKVQEMREQGMIELQQALEVK